MALSRGDGARRVRSRLGGEILDCLPGALLEQAPAGCEAKVEVTPATARLVNGRVTVELTSGGTDHGQPVVRFTATATGHAPELPGWASGYWQSKLRYRNQDELMTAAREFARRGLPLSVIVIDYFHWTHLGDWKFDPAEWPDPARMAAELRDMGIKLMVSVWPSVSPVSENFPVWWLDACEPELRPGFQENLRYYAGPGLEVGNMYRWVR